MFIPAFENLHFVHWKTPVKKSNGNWPNWCVQLGATGLLCPWRNDSRKPKNCYHKRRGKHKLPYLALKISFKKCNFSEWPTFTALGGTRRPWPSLRVAFLSSWCPSSRYRWRHRQYSTDSVHPKRQFGMCEIFDRTRGSGESQKRPRTFGHTVRLQQRSQGCRAVFARKWSQRQFAGQSTG